MHILLTRPKDDIPALKHKLVEQGFTVSACPMLDINIMPVEEGDTSTAQKLATAQAYLFTSANGVRAASHHGLTKNPNLARFCCWACHRGCV
jgi:uroporphyrinogen-III synthase